MATSLARFVTSSIRRATRFSSRPNFSMATILGYHTLWPALSRTFSDPSELLTLGMRVDHPIYLAAVALCSSTDRPPQFKVGKRAGAPTQSMRLTPSTPAEGDLYSFTVGGVTFTVEADAGETVATLIDEVVLQVNADPDAIIASGVASAATAQELDITDFDGVIGAQTDDSLSPPRNLTFTLGNHADWDVGTITVVGRYQGRVQTETFAVPNGGNTVLTGTKLFDMSPAALNVTTIAISAMTGTGGTLLVGVGKKFDEDGHLTITATDGTTHVDIAGDDAGDWFTWRDLTDNWAIEDRTAVPGTTLTTDLTNLRNADAAWFGLMLADAQSEEQILQAAAWAETQPVLLLTHGIDTDEETDDEAGISRALKDLERLHAKHFHTRKNHGRFPEAVAFGVVHGPFVPGQADWEFKTLPGIEADAFAEDVITRIVGTGTDPLAGKNGTIYVEAVPAGTNEGTNLTVGGLVAGGEWADIVTGLIWLDSELEGSSFDFRKNDPKVPYTDAGIDRHEGIVFNTLLRASRAPYNLLEESTLTTRATTRAESTLADRQARVHRATYWGAGVQGAIRHFFIDGEVSP